MSVNQIYSLGAKSFLLSRFRGREKRIPVSECLRPRPSVSLDSHGALAPKPDAVPFREGRT